MLLVIENRLDANGRLTNSSERLSKFIRCGTPPSLRVAVIDKPELKATA
jgi:hypothetical protein